MTTQPNAGLEAYRELQHRVLMCQCAMHLRVARAFDAAVATSDGVSHQTRVYLMTKVRDQARDYRARSDVMLKYLRESMPLELHAAQGSVQ